MSLHPGMTTLRVVADPRDQHLHSALDLLERGAYELAVLAAQLHLRSALRAGAPDTAGLGRLSVDDVADAALVRHLCRYRAVTDGDAAIDHAAALDSIVAVCRCTGSDALAG